MRIKLLFLGFLALIAIASIISQWVYWLGPIGYLVSTYHMLRSYLFIGICIDVFILAAFIYTTMTSISSTMKDYKEEPQNDYKPDWAESIGKWLIFKPIDFLACIVMTIICVCRYYYRLFAENSLKIAFTFIRITFRSEKAFVAYYHRHYRKAYRHDYGKLAYYRAEYFYLWLRVGLVLFELFLCFSLLLLLNHGYQSLF
jgi:hypothetical protein